MVAGTGALSLDGEPGPVLHADRGLWIPPGAEFEAAAGRGRGPARHRDAAGQHRGRAEGVDPASDPGRSRSSDLAECEVETTG